MFPSVRVVSLPRAPPPSAAAARCLETEEMIGARTTQETCAMRQTAASCAVRGRCDVAAEAFLVDPEWAEFRMWRSLLVGSAVSSDRLERSFAPSNCAHFGDCSATSGPGRGVHVRAAAGPIAGKVSRIEYDFPTALAREIPVLPGGTAFLGRRRNEQTSNAPRDRQPETVARESLAEEAWAGKRDEETEGGSAMASPATLTTLGAEEDVALSADHKLWFEQYTFARLSYVAKHANQEVRGYILSGAARGPVIGFLAVFSVLALTGLAEAAQDCDTRRVSFFGTSLRTTSVVSAALTFEGIMNAIVNPLVGAMADGSSKRTAVFRASLYAMALGLFGAFLSLFFEGTTVAMLIFALFLVSISLAYDVMAILHASFVPEIAQEPDYRTKVVEGMYVMLNFMQFFFVVVAVGIGFVAGISDDKIVAPQVGAIIAILMWAFWALPGMYMMKPRPKEKDEIIPAGFLGIPRVAGMIKLCFTTYKQVGIYLIMYSTGVTGASAVVALAPTYLLSELGLGGFSIQVLSALTLIFTIPGALVISRLARKLGDLRKANLFFIVYWLVIVALVPVFLVGEPDPDATPDDADFCVAEDDEFFARKPKGISSFMGYVFAVLWGVGIGAIFPINVALFSELVPGGSETAFFGVRTFASKVFAFLPPLLYTAINEATDKPRLSILGVMPFLIIGTFFAWLLDLDKAKEEIQDTLVLRFDATDGATGGKVAPKAVDPNDV
ncbi:Autophagy-related protein 22 [Durusdinium trenchii]|uniref:Autophagy-related protein 22 n=1 Tax=Durusdinium trenchii TaxID=1381693 RepID=A0ABP0PP03_9DINO